MTEQELAELDLAVARAEGLDVMIAEGDACLPTCVVKNLYARAFQPTLEWALAGPLLEKYGLELSKPFDRWRAEYSGDKCAVLIAESGETPQIAICKAVVALATKSRP